MPWPSVGVIPMLLLEKATHHTTPCRFSETEAVAVLSIIISKYKVELLEEPQYANETFEEKKARVLAVKRGITLT